MGEVFAGRYELIDPIGEGGMSSVWRARDLRSGTIVAAKALRQSDASALLRFVREQAVRVHHPHIVVPLGWAGEDNRVVFAMPLVSGGSLATLVNDHGPLPPRFVAEVLRQLLSAVSAVHEADLVHRDIKPANVLLAATGIGRPHAFLSDFGIALDLKGPRFTETGIIAGTPGYVAPEVKNLEDPTPASDLYSVGMLGRVMLTGLSPNKLDATAPAPPGTPPSLWGLVDDLTDERPLERPSTAAALHRLAAPELAWTPDAIGEVEVFDHLASLGTTRGIPTHAPPSGQRDQAPTQIRTPVYPSTPAQQLYPGSASDRPPGALEHPRRSWTRTRTDALVLGLVAAIVLVGIVLVVVGQQLG